MAPPHPPTLNPTKHLHFKVGPLRPSLPLSLFNLYSPSRPLISIRFSTLDFISSIINDNEVEWSKLIVQDLARLLELKFREFKKSVALLNSNKSAPIRNFITNTSISLDVDTDLFTKIAQKVLELASEEPNGILGARIRLRIMCEGGQCYDMCQCFAYDSNTMATSEITVTIKEDIRSLKKLLQTFKLYSNFSKYVSLHVDSNNFDIIKKRLY